MLANRASYPEHEVITPSTPTKVVAMLFKGVITLSFKLVLPDAVTKALEERLLVWLIEEYKVALALRELVIKPGTVTLEFVAQVSIQVNSVVLRVEARSVAGV